MDDDEDNSSLMSNLVPLRHLSVLSRDSRFNLPKGWNVKLVLREDHSRVDKYYFEPDTKQMFRSRRQVERYLNGEEYTPRSKSPVLGYHPRLTIGNFCKEKMIMPGGRRLLRIDDNKFDQRQLAVVTPTSTAATSPFILPEGWVVKKVPRKDQGCEKYYYEPGTGRKFRSLVAVKRHLQEVKRENQPVSHMFEMPNWGRKKKRMWASVSDFVEPPDKIKWILKDSGGLAWNPLMGKASVPHPITNQWAFKFMQLMSDKTVDVPDLKRWNSGSSGGVVVVSSGLKPKPPVNSASIRSRAEGIMRVLSYGCASEVRIRQLLGDSPDTSKALRMLLKKEWIRRSGIGGRWDPYVYKTAQELDYISKLDQGRQSNTC